ncbi:MAG: hypothetical protein AAGA80_24605 [Cyanobacteria bacterium P01_F01_bin.143]
MKSRNLFIIGISGLILASTGVLLTPDTAESSFPYLSTTLVAYDKNTYSPYQSGATHLSDFVTIKIPSYPAYVYAHGPENSDVDLLVYDRDFNRILDKDTPNNRADFGQDVSGTYKFRVFLERCPNDQERCTVHLRHSKVGKWH